MKRAPDKGWRPTGPGRASRSLWALWALCAGAVCAGGCAPPAERGFDSPGPVARLLAVSDAAAARDRSKVPNLIESLEHPDPAVRFLAAATLRDITGETMGYRAHDPELERVKAVERWREWWRTQGQAAAVAADERPKPQAAGEAADPAAGAPRR